MFSTMSRFSSPGQAFSNVYRHTGAQTGVNGASPHALVKMLFDGLTEAMTTALGAMRSKNIQVKCQSISRAARIVDEGLAAALDMDGGGQLAADLADLYSYITLRLTVANLRNDEQALEECRRLIEPLRQAWADIDPNIQQGQPR